MESAHIRNVNSLLTCWFQIRQPHPSATHSFRTFSPSLLELNSCLSYKRLFSHIYRGEESIKKAFVVCILAMLSLGIMFSAVRVPPASAASQIAINNAIDKGLAYLNTTQLSDGRWQDNGFPVASTAMAVLAFENSHGQVTCRTILQTRGILLQREDWIGSYPWQPSRL